jgi:small-conductance mechanosensitive channel
MQPGMETTAAQTNSGSNPEAVVTLPENYTSEQVDAILARLSDDQVRQLLIAELRKAASDQAADQTVDEDSGLVSELLNEVEDGSGIAHQRMTAIASNLKNIPADIVRALGRLTEGKGAFHLVWVLTVILLIFLAGFGVEQLFRRWTAHFRKKIESIPPMEGLLKFWSALLKMLPELFSIVIFGLSCLVLSLPFYETSTEKAILLFDACLAGILISRLIAMISRLLCSPEVSVLRLLPLGDSLAEYLHRNLVRLTRYVVFGYLICMLFYEYLIPLDSYITLTIVVGTILMGMIAGLVWKNRSAVAETILKCVPDESEGRQWFKAQFAAIWHILTFVYLFFIWLVWVGRLIVLGPTFDDALIISLLIVPVYLALDRAGQWIVRRSSGQFSRSSQEAAAGPPTEMDARVKIHESRYLQMVIKFVRVIIFCAVLFWLMGIWGVRLPFGEALVKAVFNIFITLVLAHIVWGLISSLISRKLLESGPDEAEGASGEDDEWGAVALGRGHTLLPLLLKFVGSALVVIVTLIVLSSIGIHIGPLLAGAGVLGLAVGFGAQKLVSDVLSGIFYLIDDSFRIGEYMQAGGVSGTVEKITLRNLWLRHHRGMLQIVPFSELGAITNFMRGGMVIKFDLQLPYDTDIDTVRKVVKKVGQAMMEDEEFGPDLIKPPKSQGVKGIADSVMKFGVKFTAKPGTQFVIRRELFKRINEALEKKGIKYAHRKVIVDVEQRVSVADQIDGAPTDDSSGKSESSDLPLNPALKAGGAAALDTILKDEAAAQQSKK